MNDDDIVNNKEDLLKLVDKYYNEKQIPTIHTIRKEAREICIQQIASGCSFELFKIALEYTHIEYVQEAKEKGETPVGDYVLPMITQLYKEEWDKVINELETE